MFRLATNFSLPKWARVAAVRARRRSACSGAGRLGAPQQPQQPVENRERVRRAARDAQVHRDVRGHAVAHFGAAPERPAVDGAGADRDDQPRLRGSPRRSGTRASRMLSLTAPVMTMPSAWRGRGDELDAEARQVEHHVAQRDQLRLAAVAAPRRDRAQPQRAAEEPAHLAGRAPPPSSTSPSPVDQLLARAATAIRWSRGEARSRRAGRPRPPPGRTGSARGRGAAPPSASI